MARQIGWAATFWFLARYWSKLVAPLALDEVVSALGLGAVFVLGLRQVVLLGASLAELLEQPPESLIRAPRDSRGALAPPPGPTDLGLTRGQVRAGPTCWICGGVNDGHQH